MNATPAPNPVELVKNALTKNYANFSGRARRSEFWFFYLAQLLYALLVFIIASVIDPGLMSDNDDEGGTGALIYLLLYIPSLIAVAARRLHDMGRTAVWLLIYFVPLGVLWLLYLLVQDSEPQPNKWGPSPKYGGNFSGGVQQSQTAPFIPPNQPSAGARMGLEADRLPDDSNLGRGGGFGRK